MTSHSYKINVNSTPNLVVNVTSTTTAIALVVAVVVGVIKTQLGYHVHGLIVTSCREGFERKEIVWAYN